MEPFARGTARKMLLAGLVGLPLFLAGTSVAGLFAPDYRRVSGHASELSLVPGLASTLFKVTAIPWELSFVVFGTGLLRLADWRSFGAICWILFGVAMCSNGIWPMGSPMHGLHALALVRLSHQH